MSLFESPLTTLFNSEGYELAVSQSQAVSSSTQPGLLVAASSSIGARFLAATDSGHLLVSGNFSATFPTTQSVQTIGYTTSSISSSVASTVSSQILASNANRSQAFFFVEGNRTWYLALSSVSSPTAYSIRLTNGSFFQLPERYVGPVAVVANGNGGGTIYITEVIL